jgi:hypothetical protein
VSPVRRLLLALAGSAVALAATACSESAAPSKEQYASMATDVCTSADEEIDAVYMDQAVDELLATTTEEGIDQDVYLERPERWVRAKVVPEYESLAGRLKSIPPPDGDRAYLGDLYSDLDARIEILHRRPSDGRAVVEADEQLRSRFESYGIEDCPAAFDETPDDEDPAKVMEAAAERMEQEGGGPDADEADDAGAEGTEGTEGTEAGSEGEGQ